MSDIARETNCHISVNDQPRDNVPSMTISVYAKSHSSAQHDLDIASEKIQKLLAGFMNIVDPGAKGRLMYEVALSYRGKHLPIESTSCAARANDPDSLPNPGPYMSLLELPFEFDLEGRKNFHAKHLLHWKVRQEMERNGCWIKVCGDDFGVPLKFCDPYVFVTGRHWKGVDQSVEYLKNYTREHMHKCGKCRFS